MDYERKWSIPFRPKILDTLAQGERGRGACVYGMCVFGGVLGGVGGRGAQGQGHPHTHTHTHHHHHHHTHHHHHHTPPPHAHHTAGYTSADLQRDVLSGAVVGIIALALGMALGIASDSTPAIG